MLYCPKCNSTYEEGTQRFCTHDGMRLLPSTEPMRNRAKPSGVFSNILERTSPPSLTDRGNETGEPSMRGRSREPDLNALKPGVGRKISPPATTETMGGNEELRKDFPLITTPPPKPASRMIRPHDIPAGHADLEERQSGPDNSSTFVPEKPEAFVGKMVKGRYHIKELLGTTPTSSAFKAEDMIIKGRVVTVRVMTDEKRDDQISRILAEERVSLSHVNHPNIAGLIDSGELTGGRPFMISEFIQGKTIKELFAAGTHFNVARVARIVRQVASALGEAHENAILHRSLKPESIVLSVAESGTEIVKVKEFAVYRGSEKSHEEDHFYLSPEQLEGGFSTFASDIYALATIAYQMLTARMPFVGRSRAELLKAQKEGLSLRPSNLRLELPAAIDEILEKALSPNPLSRYPKARDFGEAFFNALAKNSTAEDAAIVAEASQAEVVKPISRAVVSGVQQSDSKATKRVTVPAAKAEAAIATKKSVSQVEGSTRTSGFSIFRGKTFAEVSALGENFWRNIFLGVGAAVGLLFLYGIWTSWSNLFPTAPVPTATNQSRPANSSVASPRVGGSETPTSGPSNSSQSATGTTPGDMLRFENSKRQLSDDLAKHFRGFSVQYPKTWVKSNSTTNFLDIKRSTPNGIPIEQMLITYYTSAGTFEMEQKAFSSLVKKSNDTLSKLINNYRFVGQGEVTVRSGWKALEIKFEGEGTTRAGETIKLFGRRLFFPGMRADNKTGLVITLIATSLLPEASSADDVAAKGELAQVLETFEPAPLEGVF